MDRSEGKTPLSELLAQHVERPTDKGYAQFLELFYRSRLGVIGFGVPQGAAATVVSTSERPLALGTTTHAGGQAMVLAFADPPEFLRTFGPKFNAEMSGADVLKTALYDPECPGILINSARSEVSVAIHRETAELLLANQGAPGHALRKPWWKFW